MKLFLVLFLLFSSTFVLADESNKKLTQNFYVVEVLIFTNDLRMYQEQENWPEQLTLNPPSPLSYLKDVPVSSVYPALSTLFPSNNAAKINNGLPILPSTYQTLDYAAKRIQQAGRHTLVFHKAWLEKFDDNAAAANIVIEAGEPELGYFPVSGTISLSLSRYLHIKTYLWYAKFTDQPSQIHVQLPVLAENKAPIVNTDNIEALLESELNTQPAIERMTLMQQHRKMRSNEVHFIDNPLFGLLIQIRPLDSVLTQK